MIINSSSKILILAPHTDDGELGMGASIAKFIKQGNEVHYVAFSPAIESIPSGFSKDSTKNEVAAATRILGIPNKNLRILNYKVRNFPQYRQDILDDLISLRKEINPDIIFTPSTDDVHQDHSTITSEAIRAFKNRTLLGYELIWNEFSFKSDLMISVDRGEVDMKYKALQEYKTQAGRPYINEDFVYGLSKSRGVQIGVDYAESFEVIRCVIK